MTYIGKGKQIKVRKFIHPAYEEMLKVNALDMSIVGKYQYWYESPLGAISLVELKNHFYNKVWEIYSLEGNLFEGVERFTTKEAAEEQIKEYLS